MFNIYMDFAIIFFSIAGAALFFIVIREFVTWYWKLNNIEKLLTKIERNTRKEGVVYSDDKK
jgi:hypothetical protein